MTDTDGSVAAPDRLIVDIVDLRRRTGSRRAVNSRLVLDDLQVGEKSVVDGVLTMDLVVESVTEGVVASGRVSAMSRTPCRRCLRDVDLPLDVDIHEVFEASPTEGETWPIETERIDLTPVVREAVLLSLPIAPLCSDDCVGPEPDRFPTGAVPDEEPQRDERWAALDELRFDE